jgi:hypothetical protein
MLKIDNSLISQARKFYGKSTILPIIPGDRAAARFRSLGLDVRVLLIFLNDISDGILGMFVAMYDNFFVNTVRDLRLPSVLFLLDSSSNALRISTAASPVT